MPLSLNRFYLEINQKDCEIRQYLSLEYLLLNILNSRYFIRRKGNFEDLNEKTPPLYTFLPTEANRQPNEKTQCLIKKQFEKALIATELAKNFVSCWTLQDHENILMWKAYACSNIGICIVSTINRFIGSFDTNDFNKYEVYCAPVFYGNYNYSDKPGDMQFKKFLAYKDERELRFIFMPKDNSKKDRMHILVQFDYKTMIDKIILSPFIKQEIAEFFKVILQNQFEIKVEKSKIKINA